MHSLLGVPDRRALLGHPRVGASWEGFALEEVLRAVSPPDAFFWATHQGAELDLFFTLQGRRLGVECKFCEAPTLTRSMQIALDDLRLDHLHVVHPGPHTYPLHRDVTAWPLGDLAGLAAQLRARTPRVERASPS